MKRTVVNLVLLSAFSVALPSAVLAKGSSGGHGGSHGGGHAGGHSGSSHGGTSGGHAAHGGGARHGGTATAGSKAASASSKPAASSGRMRGSEPVVGTAVARPAGVVPPVVSGPSRVWPYGGVFGVGLYDPLWGFASPGYGYGYAPSVGDASDPFDTSRATGALRLTITPKNAEVLMDGYYVGIVDDFNGHFHHLHLTTGPHHIDVRAPGYEAFGLDVSIQPHHTTEYRGTLQPVAP